MCEHKRNNNNPVKDKQGHLISFKKDQVSLCNEQFKDVLNKSEPETTANILIAEHDLEVNIDIPSKSRLLVQ